MIVALFAVKFVAVVDVAPVACEAGAVTAVRPAAKSTECGV